MKYKTTRAAIVNGASNIVMAGYCDLQHLLHYHNASAYTCGVYGWNFDVYHVYSLTICTGYRGMPGRRANNIREYDEKARALVNNWDMPYDDKQAAVESLLCEFCAQT